MKQNEYLSYIKTRKEEHSIINTCTVCGCVLLMYGIYMYVFVYGILYVCVLIRRIRN